MKNYYFKLFGILVLLSSNCCMGQGESTYENVYTKHNEKGHLVERWGNEETWDNDVNFREMFFYDSSENLVRKLYYSFTDDNIKCEILDNDKLRYIETKFEYVEGKLKLEKKYGPKLDNENKVIGHELFYVYNHFTKPEDDSSPSKH